MSDSIINITDYSDIHSDLVQLLESSRRAAVRSVNAVMTATYWEIGRRIVDFEQNGADRAGYGKALLKRLSVDLSAKFGRGFGVVNLQQMRLLYQTWPLDQIYQTPSDKSSPDGNYGSPIRNFVDLSAIAKAFPLPWSAYVSLLSVKNELARKFYETEALRCGWSVRQLDRQINSQFYERIALSHNKAVMLQKAELSEPSDQMTPEQAIKDPFVLEFLNLKDEYSESDLEVALIHHLADFLNESIICSINRAVTV